MSLEQSKMKGNELHPDLATSGGLRNWLPFLLGLLLAVAALEYIQQNVILKLEEAALGRDTQNVISDFNGVHVQCFDSRDAQQCYDGYAKAGKPPAILWLGNSQLAAINRVKPGDKTASTLLHGELLSRGYFLTTFSQPNANLFEHAVAFSVLSRKFDTKLLILPVFLDDIREQGIRDQVAEFLDDKATMDELRSSPIWPLVSSNLADQEKSVDVPEKIQTRQQRVEAWLNMTLGSWSSLWANRLSIKGFIASSLHYFRNKILGINSRTKRKVDDNSYREKMKVLEAILQEAAQRKIKVLLYIPPYRDDIDGPYVDTDYARLKSELKTMAERFGAGFFNIENTVPGPEWATVVHPIYGFEDDDFMHFTGSGHKRLAEAINKALKKMEF